MSAMVRLALPAPDLSFGKPVAGFLIQYLTIVGPYASAAHYALRFGCWRAGQKAPLCKNLPRWLCKPQPLEN